MPCSHTSLLNSCTMTGADKTAWTDEERALRAGAASAATVLASCGPIINVSVAVELMATLAEVEGSSACSATAACVAL